MEITNPFKILYMHVQVTVVQVRWPTPLATGAGAHVSTVGTRNTPVTVPT